MFPLIWLVAEAGDMGQTGTLPPCKMSFRAAALLWVCQDLHLNHSDVICHFEASWGLLGELVDTAQVTAQHKPLSVRTLVTPSPSPRILVVL